MDSWSAVISAYLTIFLSQTQLHVDYALWPMLSQRLAESVKHVTYFVQDLLTHNKKKNISRQFLLNTSIDLFEEDIGVSKLYCACFIAAVSSENLQEYAYAMRTKSYEMVSYFSTCNFMPSLYVLEEEEKTLFVYCS